jgi:hypothetical protein
MPRNANDDLYEKIQREELLNGFTARELQGYGCYPNPNAELHKLTNDIQ